MAFKFNWGHGLATAIAMFVIFISFFVYKTLADPNYNHALVSEEYYKEELHYQNEIDRLENANKLKQDIVINHTSKGLEFVFPSGFDYQKISGLLKLQRISNAELDFEKEIKLDSLTYLIPDNSLVGGYYNLKLNWEYDGIPYQLKQKISY